MVAGISWGGQKNEKGEEIVTGLWLHIRSDIPSFGCTLLIRSQLLGPAHTQREGLRKDVTARRLGSPGVMLETVSSSSSA